MSHAAQLLRGIFRNTAQHGVDQPGIARIAPVRLDQPDRQVDRRVVGHVEPEDLRRADQQRGLDPRRILRDAAVEIEAEQMAQRAEAAQHRRDQPAGEGAVALGQRREPLMRAAAVELIVERAAAPQHAFEDVGGDPARGEALRFRRWAQGNSCAHVARIRVAARIRGRRPLRQGHCAAAAAAAALPLPHGLPPPVLPAFAAGAVGRRGALVNPLPPTPISDASCCSAAIRFSGRGMGREQVVPSVPAGQRVDDEHVRGGGILLPRSGSRSGARRSRSSPGPS